MTKTTDFGALRTELNLRDNTNRAAVLKFLAKHQGEKIRIDRLARAIFGSTDEVNKVTFAIGKLRERILELKLSKKYRLEWIDEDQNWFFLFTVL
jgi:DNA-binding response OmpR family regulator